MADYEFQEFLREAKAWMESTQDVKGLALRHQLDAINQLFETRNFPVRISEIPKKRVFTNSLAEKVKALVEKESLAMDCAVHVKRRKGHKRAAGNKSTRIIKEIVLFCLLDMDFVSQDGRPMSQTLFSKMIFGRPLKDGIQYIFGLRNILEFDLQIGDDLDINTNSIVNSAYERIKDNIAVL